MKKTLIVDDDVTSSMLLQEILERYGPVDCAANGREAVNAVRNALQSHEPYDLICLDILMPEMDGWEALKRIRTLEKLRRVPPSDSAKVFMITALDDLNTVMHASSGCDAYLLKPIEKAKVLERLREFILAG